MLPALTLDARLTSLPQREIGRAHDELTAGPAHNRPIFRAQPASFCHLYVSASERGRESHPMQSARKDPALTSLEMPPEGVTCRLITPQTALWFGSSVLCRSVAISPEDATPINLRRRPERVATLYALTRLGEAIAESIDVTLSAPEPMKWHAVALVASSSPFFNWRRGPHPTRARMRRGQAS